MPGVLRLYRHQRIRLGGFSTLIVSQPISSASGPFRAISPEGAEAGSSAVGLGFPRHPNSVEMQQSAPESSDRGDDHWKSSRREPVVTHIDEQPPRSVRVGSGSVGLVCAESTRRSG